MLIFLNNQDDRDYVAVRKKFFDLVPRGNIPVQLQSAENIRAELVQKRINARQSTGVMPPPTPPDVLITLYQNSHLPLPSYLLPFMGGDATMTTTTTTGSSGRLSSPDCTMNASVTAPMTTSASTTTTSLLGKRKGNNNGHTGDSLVNLVNAGNGSGGTVGGNGYANANGMAASSTNNGYASMAASSFLASTFGKNDDFLQYCAHPQSYRPSPFGAGLSIILNKILVEPTLRNTSPTVVPPSHQPNVDQVSSSEVASSYSLASLVAKRAQEGAVPLLDAGKLEDICLDMYSAHDKLAVFFAQKLPESPDESTPEHRVDDSTDHTPEITSSLGKERDAELVEMEKILASSVQCVQQVAQWLDVNRPQFKKLKPTPFHALRIKPSVANSSNTYASSIGFEDKELERSVTQQPFGVDELGDAEYKQEEEDDDDDDDDERDDDGAADDFEDLYDIERKSVNNSAVMDTD